MSERERTQIARMFERQGQLNRLLIFNMISLENALLLEKERVQLMEKTFREANVFEDWPPLTKNGELTDIEATDKFSEILIDLTYDRGSHTIPELIAEVNQKDFLPEKKKLFKDLLIQMGTPPSELRALKIES